MTKLRSALVLLVALVVGFTLAVPAEDVPETAYDECDSLPYESTPVFSVAIPDPFAEEPAVRPPVSLPRLGSLRRLGAQRFDHGTGSPVPISGSLTVLDHSFRC